MLLCSIVSAQANEVLEKQASAAAVMLVAASIDGRLPIAEELG